MVKRGKINCVMGMAWQAFMQGRRGACHLALYYIAKL
jgi:hypothetical protein